MMDKCEEEIQKHLSAYEDLECSMQMMQPKALTLQSIDDLLLWYVQSNSEKITSDSLKNLKQKFKISFSKSDLTSEKCNKSSKSLSSLDSFIDVLVETLNNLENSTAQKPCGESGEKRNMSCQTYPVFKRKSHAGKSGKHQMEKTSGSPHHDGKVVEYTYDSSACGSAISKDCKMLLDSIYKCLIQFIKQTSVY